MNILVAIISTFAPRKAEKTYTVLLNNCSVRTVTACHTNESILSIMSYFVNTKKSTGLRCISYTACLYSSSLRWKDSYISSGTL